MPMVIGDVELHMGPTEVGAPDDLEKVIVDFIEGAQRKLDIAVQELESKPIAKAIIRARQRGRSVRLMVESDYLSVKKAVPDPWNEGGTNEANREIFNAVLRSKIKVRSDFNTNIFHQKFIIRDGSAVLTGSTNFTPTGVKKNLNHVVVVKDRKVANAYKKEFREINAGHFGRYNLGHDDTPRDVIVSELPIRVLFAPDHNPEMEIMKQIAKARKRIDFAIFTFSKSSGIDDALIQAGHANVTVRGVFDALMGNRDWAATRLLHGAGAEAHLVRKRGPLGKLHHKLMVIDRQVVIAGSFNYTRPATKLNDENIIILGDLDTESNEARKAQRKLAKYALDEIDRIIKDHGEKVH